MRFRRPKEISFSCKSLGTVRISLFGFSEHKQFRTLYKDLDDSSAKEVARALIGILGRHSGEPKGGGEARPLTRKDLGRLTDEELEDFASIYIKNSSWVFDRFRYRIKETKRAGTRGKGPASSHEELEVSKNEEETNVEYLRRLLVQYNDRALGRRKASADRVTRSPAFPDRSNLASRLVRDGPGASGEIRSDPPSCEDFQSSDTPENRNGGLKALSFRIEQLHPPVEKTALLLKNVKERFQPVAGFPEYIRNRVNLNRIVVVVGLAALLAIAFISFLDYRATILNYRATTELNGNLSVLISDVTHTTEQVASLDEAYQSLEETVFTGLGRLDAISARLGELDAVSAGLGRLEEREMEVLESLDQIQRKSGEIKKVPTPGQTLTSTKRINKSPKDQPVENESKNFGYVESPF